MTLGISDDKEVLNTVRIDSKHPEDKADHYQKDLENLIKGYDRHAIKASVICSVVEERSSVIINIVKERFNVVPFIVDHTIKTGLQFKNNTLQTLGADRIANAVAAHNLYNGHLMVIDFGTATTMCTITEDGDYLGGAIMPGIGISAEVLNEKTSGLPLVDIKAPEHIPGRDTRENILTGLVVGHAGAVEKIVHEIRLVTKKSFSLIATGGYAGLVSPLIKQIDSVHPSLTLDGLRIIYTLNC